MNNRKDILDLLIPYFEADERYHLLFCDCGFAAIDKLQELFPNRVRNMGIQEQNTVSVASGMAMEGLKPIIFSITQFLVMRSFEQVRNTSLQHLNVKFIGTGSANYFSFLGESHCCNDDDIQLMELAGMKIYNSFSPDVNFELMVANWIKSKKASYIRI